MAHSRAAILLLCCLAAGCARSGYTTSGWDGRRGYDGNGDYGYDVAASQAEARTYETRAARAYPAPGTPDDPWGPHIREAAARFHVPEQWVRAVMRQESGGHEYQSDGSPITSSAGAMGLMQVMPRTYDILRQHYGLGTDPYDPHDNILAGTAYIREMYDAYGAPGFLAAYNAGPARLDAYISGGNPLPDETVNYVASIAPHLGPAVAMSGPLAAYAGGSGGGGIALASAAAPASDGAYMGGGMVAGGPVQQAAADDGDPADRAFDGGGLVTASAPTGLFTGRSAPAAPPPFAPPPFAPPPFASRPFAPPPAAPASVQAPSIFARVGASPAPGVLARPALAAPAVVPVLATATLAAPRTSGGWAVQVGAYPDPAISARAIAAARARAADLLAAAQPAVIPVQRNGLLYRARLVGLTSDRATAACARLSGQGTDCFVVPPGS